MRWEHGWLRQARQTTSWHGPGPGPASGLELTEALAELGAAGWELVAVLSDEWYHDGAPVTARDHYFKRPAED